MAALRLCYCLPSSSPKDLIGLFWPDVSKPTHPAQLLLKYADFLRVHHVAEGYLVEVVAGFLKSAPAEVSHSQVHTLWIEPLAPNLIQEGPFDVPGPSAPHLKPLPEISLQLSRPTTDDTVQGVELRTKEKHLNEALDRVNRLRTTLAERDAQIKEMRAGGIGTAPQLPPPDPEALLEAFQEHFFESRYLIRQFEQQIQDLEARKASPPEINAAKKKMEELAQRQSEWLKKIAKTLQALRSGSPS